jgi:hypothetical protein
MNQPLSPIDELFEVAPRALRIRVGLPHPLAKFGIAGQFEDGLYADIILYFIHAAMMEEPESRRFKGAMWLFFESEQTFFFVCDEAGIDAVRLRDHLRNCLGMPVDVRDGWKM